MARERRGGQLGYRVRTSNPFYRQFNAETRLRNSRNNLPQRRVEQLGCIGFSITEKMRA